MYVLLANDPSMEAHVKKEAQKNREKFRKNDELWNTTVGGDPSNLSPNDAQTITFRGHGFAPDDNKDPTFGANRELLALNGFTPQQFYEMLKTKKASGELTGSVTTLEFMGCDIGLDKRIGKKKKKTFKESWLSQLSTLIAKDVEFDHIKEIKGPFYKNEGNKYTHLFGLRKDSMSGALFNEAQYNKYKAIAAELKKFEDIQKNIKAVQQQIDDLKSGGKDTRAKEQELQNLTNTHGSEEAINNKINLKTGEKHALYNKLHKPYSIKKQASAREFITKFTPMDLDEKRKEIEINNKRGEVIFKEEGNFSKYNTLVENYREVEQNYYKGIGLQDKADIKQYEKREAKLVSQNKSIARKYKQNYGENIGKVDIKKLLAQRKEIEEAERQKNEDANEDPFAFPGDEEEPEERAALKAIEAKIEMVEKYQRNLREIKGIPKKIKDSKEEFEAFIEENGDIDTLNWRMQSTKKAINDYLTTLNFTEVEKTRLENHGKLHNDNFIQDFLGSSVVKSHKRDSETLDTQEENSSDSHNKRKKTLHRGRSDTGVESSHATQITPEVAQQREQLLKFIHSESAKEKARDHRVTSIVETSKKWASSQPPSVNSMDESEDLSKSDDPDNTTTPSRERGFSK